MHSQYMGTTEWVDRDQALLSVACNLEGESEVIAVDLGWAANRRLQSANHPEGHLGLLGSRNGAMEQV